MSLAVWQSLSAFFGTLFILDHLPPTPLVREVKTLRTALQRHRLDRLSYPILIDVPMGDLNSQLVGSGHLFQSPDAEKEARYVSLDGRSYGLLFHIDRTASQSVRHALSDRSRSEEHHMVVAAADVPILRSDTTSRVRQVT
jgi:hypothetical protein